MKNFIYFFLFIVIFACENPLKSTNSNEQEIPVQKAQIQTSLTSFKNSENENLLGYYVGDFEADSKVKSGGTYVNKITISIEKIDGNKITGQSIVAGNYRPFSGTIDNQTFKVTAKEPGDDKYDGTFEFQILENGKKIKGTWTAYNKNLRVTRRKYDLQKQEYQYNKDLKLPDYLGWTDLYNGVSYADKGEFLTEDVLKFNASNTELKKEDVENMYKGDLEVIRNSIYARHGYSFKNRKMRYVFDRIDWYIPISVDIRSKITPLEKKNIELLKRYEQHATAYYDSFGR